MQDEVKCWTDECWEPLRRIESFGKRPLKRVCRTRTPRRRALARRAGADGERRKLLVMTDLATSSPRWTGSCLRKPCAARSGRGPQRHCRGGPGHPDAEEGPGHEGGARAGSSDHFERPAGAYNARPHDTVHGRPRTWRSSRRQSSGSCKTTPTSSSTTRTSPNAGAFRAPTNAARSFNPGAVDSMTVRSTEGRETLAEAGAAGAAGQRQRGGPLTRRGRSA